LAKETQKKGAFGVKKNANPKGGEARAKRNGGDTEREKRTGENIFLESQNAKGGKGEIQGGMTIRRQVNGLFVRGGKKGNLGFGVNVDKRKKERKKKTDPGRGTTLQRKGKTWTERSPNLPRKRKAQTEPKQKKVKTNLRKDGKAGMKVMEERGGSFKVLGGVPVKQAGGKGRRTRVKKGEKKKITLS